MTEGGALNATSTSICDEPARVNRRSNTTTTNEHQVLLCRAIASDGLLYWNMARVFTCGQQTNQPLKKRKGMKASLAYPTPRGVTSLVLHVHHASLLMRSAEASLVSLERIVRVLGAVLELTRPTVHVHL